MTERESRHRNHAAATVLGLLFFVAVLGFLGIVLWLVWTVPQVTR